MTKQQGALSWMLLIILSIIWGSSFILMKRGLETFSPLQVAALRIFISFLCLFPFAIGNIKKIAPSKWKFIAASGLLGNAIPAFLFPIAQTRVSSAMAGMLNSVTTLLTLVVGWLFFKASVSTKKISGVIIGFIGAAGLILINSNGKIGVDFSYGMIIVLATLCYAFSVNILRYNLHDVPSVSISGFALSFVGPPLGIYLLTTDFIQKMNEAPGAWLNLGYVTLLAVFGTAVSIVLFNNLIKISGAVYSSSVTYLIPVVAVLWGIFDNEPFGILHLLAFALIILGVCLINRSGSRAG